jgi:hypothetical protein
MINGAPKIAKPSVYLYKRLVHMPAPLRIAAHIGDASLSDLRGEHRSKRFHQNRTVSWLMSIPRSARRSSTLRSDSGYRTYIITTRRMTSGELLKYRNGLVMPQTITPEAAKISSDKAGRAAISLSPQGVLL